MVDQVSPARPARDEIISNTDHGTSPRPKIVLDCDPGHDDAMAILFAAHRTDLLGITTVSGNAPLANSTRNALIVSQLAELDVEVHAGASRPLFVEARHARHVHGESGLDGPELPPLTRAADSNDAIDFIVETVRANDDVWLVPIGPMTNIALAIRQAPDLVERVAGISFMGGSSGPGNVTAAAEFNFWADPHAAQIVLASGVPRVVMAGLNLTGQFTVDRVVAKQLTALGTRCGAFAADVVEAYVQAGERNRGTASAMMHDPCAVMALTDPHLFDTAMRHVDVSVDGITQGMSVVDDRGFGGAETNVEVLTTIDRDAGVEALVEAIGTHP